MYITIGSKQLARLQPPPNDAAHKRQREQSKPMEYIERSLPKSAVYICRRVTEHRLILLGIYIQIYKTKTRCILNVNVDEMAEIYIPVAGPLRCKHHHTLYTSGEKTNPPISAVPPRPTPQSPSYYYILLFSFYLVVLQHIHHRQITFCKLERAPPWSTHVGAFTSLSRTRPQSTRFLFFF